MVHKNSLSVYQELIQPQIKQRHLAVMDALAVLGTASSLDVADYLRKPLNAISGRLSELSGRTKDYSTPMIESVGNKINRYGNKCAVWRIKEPASCGI